MKISLNWLKDYVDIDSKISPKDLADLITVRTAEVEGFCEIGGSFKNMVVGRIKTIKAHPNADKLTITETDVGGGKILQIVCGAKNIYEGMFVPVAMPGAFVRWHGEGEPVELKPASLRGVESFGMLCAGEEIGLESKEDGIYDLTKENFKEGTPLSKVFGLSDTVFEIDNKSLTHRPDLWGHYGIAREIAAILEKPLKKLDPAVNFPAKGETVKIEIKDFELCPRYCGVILSNIQVAESPKWLKDRLVAIGQRPVSNIVDATNYVMAELGQPLHAFDRSYIKEGIIVRRAAKKEKITTLDGQARELDENMLVIADHEKPVAIAGVMGGENSEINENTREIIIESANFNAENVRKTSTKLNLRTESVQRFEKSLDPHLAETAIKRVCELILQICPEAKLAGPVNDVKKFKEEKINIDLNVDSVSSKIGVKLTSAQCKKILKSLEFGVAEKSSNVLTVTIPSFRATKDVDIEDDLVEEIARIYGYDKIEATLPELPIRLPEKNKERVLKHYARELLARAFRMSEVYNYSFYGHDEMSKALTSADENKHLMLENYLSAEETHLRTTLVPNLLKNVVSNLRFNDNFRLFEIGRTYIEKGEYFPLEEKWIGGVVVQKGKSGKSLFYEAKSITEKFLQKFLKRDFEILKSKKEPSYAHPAKSARVMVQGRDAGGVFEVNPMVLKNFGIDASVAMFELNFTELAQLEQHAKKYEPIAKFPGICIDISVVVDKKVKAAEIESAIKRAGKDLIARMRLFDVYEGESLGAGKKSLAYNILLQSPERTLTDDEMARIQRRMFTNLQELGGAIRGI